MKAAVSGHAVTIVGLVLVIAGAMYWVAWRSKYLHAPGEPPDPRVVARQERFARARSIGQDLYDRLKMLGTERIESIEQLDAEVGSLIWEDLEKHVSTDDPAHSPETLAKIRSDLVGLIYYRWVQPSFDEYDRFMTQAGYTLPDRFEEMNSGHQIALEISLRIHAKREINKSKPPRDLVRELWEAMPPGGGRAADMRAIAVDPDGIEVVMARVCSPEYDLPSLGGALGHAGWDDGDSATCIRFYQSPSGWPHDLLRRRSCVQVARVGIVMRFRGGDAFPFKFDCWFDPASRRWYVDTVYIGNDTEDFGGVFF